MSRLDEQERIAEPAPPDEWLALSAAERAALQRRAAEFDPDELEASQCVVPQPAVAVSEPSTISDEPEPPPDPDEIVRWVESLELDERIRLVSRLWQTLPLKKRTALITLGLSSLQHSAREAADRATTSGGPLWQYVWRALFDPSNTSDLYSAPRRFDLATIFVVTAAYSLLFAGLRALDFGPLPMVTLGSVITLVAVAQSLLQGVANPRGVSLVAGAAGFSAFCLLWFTFRPRVFDGSLFNALMTGLIAGSIIGYMSGVLVGGVFLAADALRRNFDRGDDTPSAGPSNPFDE